MKLLEIVKLHIVLLDFDAYIYGKLLDFWKYPSQPRYVEVNKRLYIVVGRKYIK